MSATITLDTMRDTRPDRPASNRALSKTGRLQREGKPVPLPLLLLMLGDKPACAHLGSEGGTLTYASPNMVRCAACMESLDLGSKWTCDDCWQLSEVLWDLTVPTETYTMTFHLCLRCTCREVELAAPEVGPNDHLTPTELVDVVYHRENGPFVSGWDLMRAAPHEHCSACDPADTP